MPPLVGGRILVAKIETTFGTDVLGGSYTAADVLPVDPSTIRLDKGIEEYIDRATMGYLGNLPSSVGARNCAVSWKQAIRGRGAAYSASVLPEVDLGLRACLMGRTLDTTPGAEKVTYQPVTELVAESLSIYAVQPIPGGNALTMQLVGCRGSYRIVGRVGTVVVVEFSLQGVWEEEADLAFTNGTLAPTPKYPFLAGAQFQIGSANYAPPFSQFAFDAGVTIVREPSGNAATGYLGYTPTQRSPLLTFDPTIDREATSGWFAKLTAGDLHDLSFRIGSGTNYNRMLFQMNAAAAAGGQVVSKRLADRDGIAAFEVGVRSSISGTGQNDYALIFDKGV